MEMIENDWLVQVRELQAIGLDILKELSRICQKNNIDFYMAEGSLLGAVRHNGFIPWDDDVDVAMLREDYDRFIAIASCELSDNYVLQHHSTMDNYWLPFAKIRLKTDSTKYRQAHVAHLTEYNGPFIDIFPLDTLPKKGGLSQRLNEVKIKFTRGMITRKLKCKPHRDISGAIAYFCSKFYSVKKLHKKLDRLHTKMNRADNQWVVNWESAYGIARETFPKESFSKVILTPFADTQMPVPQGYDTILKTTYGDYMTLPPVEEQVCKHRFNDDQ